MILEKVVKMLCDDCWAHNKNRRCNKTDAPLCYGYLAESILSIPEIKDALKKQEDIQAQIEQARRDIVEKIFVGIEAIVRYHLDPEKHSNILLSKQVQSLKESWQNKGQSLQEDGQ